jgi:ATP-dependent Clp protease protease subunit
MHSGSLPFETVCVGMAASIAAFLLAAAKKGKRIALPNSEVLSISEGGAEGQLATLKSPPTILKTKAKINQLLSKMTAHLFPK